MISGLSPVTSSVVPLPPGALKNLPLTVLVEAEALTEARRRCRRSEPFGHCFSSWNTVAGAHDGKYLPL